MRHETPKGNAAIVDVPNMAIVDDAMVDALWESKACIGDDERRVFGAPSYDDLLETDLAVRQDVLPSLVQAVGQRAIGVVGPNSVAVEDPVDRQMQQGVLSVWTRPGGVCRTGGRIHYRMWGRVFPRWFWRRFRQRAAVVEAWLLLVERMVSDGSEILNNLMG
ncbi:hypothetical protein NE237_004233 [Protea cynaroides]|uniref:Uncharacterized protein n=1 Tax=Protea cynaroides TaxID=273540 RepID=A0A9Q0KIJ4_9MAGN|nr:hypothetical protein NE237_004233 [Protea cynaroides]